MQQAELIQRLGGANAPLVIDVRRRPAFLESPDAAGMEAHPLEGGIEGWAEARAPLDSKPRGASTRWVTRERPKIDRIACPWLVRRFKVHTWNPQAYGIRVAEVA